MARVLVNGMLPTRVTDRLRDSHQVEVWDSDDPIPRPELLRRVAGVEALITVSTAPVDRELLDAAGSQLRVVANVAAGFDNVDLPACAERGVTVTNTPGVLDEATADVAFALVLMTTRRLVEADRLVRSGTPWQWGMEFLLGAGLQGRTLGVVGLGQIGAATARRARAFGMDIVYHNRSRVQPDLESELGAEPLGLNDLLAVSDVVTLHCPYRPETHHLIDAKALATMKDTAYLINTARGPIVDESALVEALQAGTIAGAGLDVFEHEPAVHPALPALDTVVLLPHLGSATQETRTAMASLAVDNTLAVLSGADPLTPVTH